MNSPFAQISTTFNNLVTPLSTIFASLLTMVLTNAYNKKQLVKLTLENDNSNLRKDLIDERAAFAEENRLLRKDITELFTQFTDTRKRLLNLESAFHDLQKENTLLQEKNVDLQKKIDILMVKSDV